MIWILRLARAAQLWPLTITIAARPDSASFTKICRSAGSTAECRIDIGPVLEVQIRKCPGILAQRGNTMIKDVHGIDSQSPGHVLETGGTAGCHEGTAGRRKPDRTGCSGSDEDQGEEETGK